VDLAPEGGAFFPPVNLDHWREVGREERQTEEGIRYAFADYERIVPAPSGPAAA